MSSRLFLAILFLTLIAPVSHAQGGLFWKATEVQLMLSPETDPNLAWHDIIPDQLRIYSELQVGSEMGIYQSLIRTGPIWNLLPHFSVAAHVTTAAHQLTPGVFDQELRLELEPTFKGRFNTAIQWANRNRIEYRMRNSRDPHFRYRSRIAINFSDPESAWTPFLSQELFFDLGANFLSQTRTMIGTSYQINDSLSLSLSYLLRNNLRSGEWLVENGLFLTLRYTSKEDGIFQMVAD